MRLTDLPQKHENERKALQDRQSHERQQLLEESERVLSALPGPEAQENERRQLAAGQAAEKRRLAEAHQAAQRDFQTKSEQETEARERQAQLEINALQREIERAAADAKATPYVIERKYKDQQVMELRNRLAQLLQRQQAKTNEAISAQGKGLDALREAQARELVDQERRFNEEERQLLERQTNQREREELRLMKQLRNLEARHEEERKTQERVHRHEPVVVKVLEDLARSKKLIPKRKFSLIPDEQSGYFKPWDILGLFTFAYKCKWEAISGEVQQIRNDTWTIEGTIPGSIGCTIAYTVTSCPSHFEVCGEDNAHRTESSPSEPTGRQPMRRDLFRKRKATTEGTSESELRSTLEKAVYQETAADCGQISIIRHR